MRLLFFFFMPSAISEYSSLEIRQQNTGIKMTARTMQAKSMPVTISELDSFIFFVGLKLNINIKT